MSVQPPEGYDPKHHYATVFSPTSCNYLAYLRQKYGSEATNASLSDSELAYAKRYWGKGFKMEMMPQRYVKHFSKGGVTPVYSAAQNKILAQSAYNQVVNKGIPHPGIAQAHWAAEFDYWIEAGLSISFSKDDYLDWRAGIGPKPWKS